MKDFLLSYNPEWKTCFEQLSAVLYSALEAFTVDIQHVGSTAVPGMVAKPILDIDIIPNNNNDISSISAILEQLGYISKGEQGIPGRFAFRQRTGNTPSAGLPNAWQEHHLYVCHRDSLALKNHLLFRDALLQHPALANDYARLKLGLANTPGITRAIYATEKTAFIIQLLAAAGVDEESLEAISGANKG